MRLAIPRTVVHRVYVAAGGVGNYNPNWFVCLICLEEQGLAGAQHCLAAGGLAGAGSSRTAEAGTSRAIGGENVADDPVLHLLHGMSSHFQ